jgi:diacylglycerol kinase (ATP)
MRIAVIVNGVSGKKASFYRHVYPALATVGTVDVWETLAPGHATELALLAANQEYQVILAAGGDGTLHQVLNGVRSSTQGSHAVLGVVPLGTGNDFARFQNLHVRHTDWRQRVLAPPQLIDVGQIRFGETEKESRYFINACSVGLGPEVVHRLATGSRALGPFATYFLAIAKTFLANRPQPLMFQADTFSWSGKMRVGAVANGQSFGNKLFVAPDALAADGQFNTFIAGDVTLVDFLKYLPALKQKKKVKDPRVHYGTASRIRWESSVPLWVEAEGELVGRLPVAITLLPRAQRFLGGV